MTAYYNEFDKHAAAWLRELVKAGLIADGDVDDRPIQEVQADDLSGYQQCHFFAGIGGWSYALRLAGVADDAPVWTGSCPCQPFSSAGKRKGFDDERHVWPEFRRLIAERRPATVFGEQVAGKLGLAWLAGVFADLEAVGYACAAADLPAASVGAPHKRQRLFWVADAKFWATKRQRCNMAGSTGATENEAQERERFRDDAGAGCIAVGLADSSGPRLEGRSQQPARQERPTAERGGDVSGVGDSNSQRPDGKRIRILERQSQSPGIETAWYGEVVQCRDGRSRRIPAEPALFPLVDGLPPKLVRCALKGAGNAIVPKVAAEFIRAALTEPEQCQPQEAT